MLESSCWSTQLCRRLTWPPTSPFCWHQPSGSASGQVANRRQLTFPGCRPRDLERSAGRRDVSRVVVHILSEAQNASFHEIFCLTISWIGFHWTVSTSSGSSSSVYYLGHFKDLGMIQTSYCKVKTEKCMKTIFSLSSPFLLLFSSTFLFPPPLSLSLPVQNPALGCG